MLNQSNFASLVKLKNMNGANRQLNREVIDIFPEK